MMEDFFQVIKARVRPEGKISPKSQVNIPSNLWFKCPRCQTVVFMEEFSASNRVCGHCGYHARLTAKQRLAITVDQGSFLEYDGGMTSLNPIDFPDYEEKLRLLQQKTGLVEAVITGECTIRGQRCVLGIMDSHFMMASMGSVVGEKITRAFEKATEKRLPVVLFCASGGARMQEGMVSLMQMAKTSGAVGRHSAVGLLYIAVLTDPTTGGVTASFASLADITVAEPRVLIGFAGRRVIEGTIKQRLPDDFQSAEFLLAHGFVDRIVARTQMRHQLLRLLKFHNKEEARPSWLN